MLDLAGVNIALGTDWVPSGSMNMLRELACADSLNQTYFDKHFTDADLWRMATSNAAFAIGADDAIGMLKTGYLADIAIYDGTTNKDFRAVHRRRRRGRRARPARRPGHVRRRRARQSTRRSAAARLRLVRRRRLRQAEDRSASTYATIAAKPTLAALRTAGEVYYPLFFCKGTTPDERAVLRSFAPARSVKGSTIYTGMPRRGRQGRRRHPGRAGQLPDDLQPDPSDGSWARRPTPTATASATRATSAPRTRRRSARARSAATSTATASRTAPTTAPRSRTPTRPTPTATASATHATRARSRIPAPRPARSPSRRSATRRPRAIPKNADGRADAGLRRRRARRATVIYIQEAHDRRAWQGIARQGGRAPRHRRDSARRSASRSQVVGVYDEIFSVDQITAATITRASTRRSRR